MKWFGVSWVKQSSTLWLLLPLLLPVLNSKALSLVAAFVCALNIIFVGIVIVVDW